MRRIAVALSAALLAAAGCSLGTQPLSFGLNDRPAPTSYVGHPEGSITSKKKPNRTRTANLQSSSKRTDRAPRGSITKAPTGSLADRNYTSTRLNVEKAQRLINAYRRKNGLGSLRLNALLTKAAKAHSRDLAKWDRISHFGSDGSNPWDRVKRTGYKAQLAAENVGTGQVTLEEVMAGWKKSPGHNKNLLLRDAKHMGIALVHAPKTEFRTFWTLVLGSRL